MFHVEHPSERLTACAAERLGRLRERGGEPVRDALGHANLVAREGGEVCVTGSRREPPARRPTAGCRGAVDREASRAELGVGSATTEKRDPRPCRPVGCGGRVRRDGAGSSTLPPWTAVGRSSAGILDPPAAWAGCGHVAEMRAATENWERRSCRLVGSAATALGSSTLPPRGLGGGRLATDLGSSTRRVGERRTSLGRSLRASTSEISTIRRRGFWARVARAAAWSGTRGSAYSSSTKAGSRVAGPSS